MLLARREDVAQAEALASEAVDLALRTDRIDTQTDALMSLAAVLLVSERQAEAYPVVEDALRRAGLWREEWAAGPGRDWLAHAIGLIRPRTRLLGDFATWARAFFTDDFEYEEAAREKFWKDERLPAMLEKLAASLETITEWNHDNCEKALRDLATAEGVKAGLLINATRVAIVGRAVAPPLFETMVVLGQERVVRRVRQALPAMGAS